LKSLRSAPSIDDPKSLANHLRKCRLERGLLQQDVARMLSVSVWTYRNWENGRTTPGTVVYQRIVEFLGYYPHPTPRNVSHLLGKIRRCLGLTSRQAAHLAEVDQGTFLMWECGSWTPTARTRARVDQFLARFEPSLPPDCP
jgi:transcriptional regulator with XRE-family HTH domain